MIELIRTLPSGMFSILFLILGLSTFFLVCATGVFLMGCAAYWFAQAHAVRNKVFDDDDPSESWKSSR